MTCTCSPMSTCAECAERMQKDMQKSLYACPLCGSDEGYSLEPGSTHRWYAVGCKGCGEMITECRSEYPSKIVPQTSKAADEAWQAAAEHAESLRRALRVMYTWAEIDEALKPEMVRDLAGRALGIKEPKP